MQTSAMEIESMATVLERLGSVPPERVLMKPVPGKATEKDLLRLLLRTDRLFELVDGTLVEKVMGYGEAGLAIDLIRLLGKFLDQHDLGDLVGADATMRLMPGLVRIPDVSFIRWEKMPGKQRPTEAIPGLVPDLAVEILSEGNTSGEMKRKLKEYFLAGVSVVWFVDPRTRSVEVFTSPQESRILTEKDTLDGAEVLPGLHLAVREVFARVPQSQQKPAPRRRKKK